MFLGPTARLSHGVGDNLFCTHTGHIGGWVMNIHRERGYWDDMGLVSWVGSWGEEEFFG